MEVFVVNEALEREKSLARGKSKILILADQHAPYETVKPVIASTATAGFSNLKLVVITEH